MKNKIKNTPTGILLFIIYHLVVFLASVVFFLVTNTNKEIKFEFKSIDKIVQKIRSTVAKVTSREIGHKGSSVGSVVGEVNFYEKGLKQANKLTINSSLFSGSILETKAKSSIIAQVGEGYSINLRMCENSQLNLDSLMVKNYSTEKEDNYYNLITGSVFVSFNDNLGVASLNIKTSSLGIIPENSAEFVLLTNSSDYSIVGVYKGRIEVENFKKGTMHRIQSGSFFVVNKSGAEKNIENTSVMGMFNWGHETMHVTSPKINDLLKRLGATIQENKKNTEIPLETHDSRELEKVIEEFKIDNQNISNDIETELRMIENLQAKLDQEQNHIEKDIRCIETSSVECKLNSEKLLIERGFPRTHGSPRLRKSLVDDLNKYLKDQKVTIQEKKVLVDQTQELYKRRVYILNWALETRDSKKNNHVILEKLQHPDYQR